MHAVLRVHELDSRLRALLSGIIFLEEVQVIDVTENSVQHCDFRLEFLRHAPSPFQGDEDGVSQSIALRRPNPSRLQATRWKV
ncbi:MAG TPA: hypothetical protein VIG66_02530, partial [Noviherbaspirillum sp.]